MKYEDRIYSERGGVRITGADAQLNWTWPFAELQVWADRCEIKLPFRRIVLQRREVRSVTEFAGWFSRGVKICFAEREVPCEVVFWTRNPKKIIHLLLRLVS